MNIQDRIPALEEQISRAKNELNLLLSDYAANSSQFNTSRLEELEREVQYMSNQLAELKAAFLSVSKETVKAEGTSNSTDTPEKKVVPSKRAESLSASKSELDTPIRPAPENNTNTPDSPFDDPLINFFRELSDSKRHMHPNDLEAIFGKSLMGIFASVLIFISLIFFGTLLIPLMNDTVKQVLMFLVSFAFAGIGILRLKKDADNKFNISLASCGMGAIYISLFMSNMYFHTLNDIALYLILVGWSIGICYLSRYQSIVFQSIGQIGTIIATLFGILYYQTTQDTTLLLFLTIFLIVTELIYSIYFDRLPFVNLLINSWGITCSSALFLLNQDFSDTTFIHLMDGAGSTLLGLCRMMLLCLVLFSMMILIFKYKETTLYNVVGNMTLIFNVFLCSSLLEEVHLVSMAVIALILIGIEWSHKNEHRNFLPTQVILCILFVTAFVDCRLMKEDDYYLYAALFSFVTLTYGILRAKPEYKIYGFFWFFWMVFCTDTHPWIYLLVSLVVYTLTIVLSMRMGSLTKATKNVLYIGSLMSLYHYMLHLYHYLNSIKAPENLDLLLILGIYFGYNLWARFYRGGLVTRSITTGINGLIMFITCIVLSFSDYSGNTVLHFLFVLFAITCFSVNCKNLLERENKFWGFYLGFKYTFLLYIILNSFHVPNPAISIACLVLAIILIIVGFKFVYKILRIYGLTLSLISIIKLVLLDIDYSGTIARAFSFFICGILCFIVSAIYNRIDKQL